MRLDAGDAAPLFEAAGQDGTDGFVNSMSGINDDAAAGFHAQLGHFFLRQVVNGIVPPPFIVDYTTGQTITSLSGEIWDIDGSAALGTEQWLVEVLNGANAVITSTMSPLGTGPAGDSLPWTFSFGGLPAGVDKVRITFIGTKTQGLGLAFNNFRPTTVPEPFGLVIAALGAVGLAGLRRRAAR